MTDEPSPLGSVITLRGAIGMPTLGVGLYKVAAPDMPRVVEESLDIGYRLFDTATMYQNEDAFGEALARSGIHRDQVFLTTKVLNRDQGFESTRTACHRSLDLLQVDQLDLYLIHWPAPKQNRYRETWEALISLQEEGVVRAIGVSNFHSHHLEQVIEATGHVPVINQVEGHPWLPQEALIAWHRAHGIVTQAWSPLARGRLLSDPLIARIGVAHGVSPAAVLLSWQLHRGVAVLAKTTSRARLQENMNALDVRLTAADLAEISCLETGERTGADPDDRD